MFETVCHCSLWTRNTNSNHDDDFEFEKKNKMGPRVDKNQKCGFMGCDLPRMHSGMHNSSCVAIRRNRKKQEIDNTKEAMLRSSLSISRNDELISHDDIKYQLIIGRLHVLQKQITDLLQAIE